MDAQRDLDLGRRTTARIAFALPVPIAVVALAVTAAAMPLYVFRWHAGPVPTTLLENLIAITIAVYAVTVLTRRSPLPGRTALDLPIVLFVLAGVIGILVSPDHRGALGIFRAYLLEPIAVYYVAVAVLRPGRATDVLFAAWAIGAMLFSAGDVAALAQAVTSHRLRPGHAASIFDINPNSVALYLEPLIAVAAGYALFATGRRRSLAILVLAVLLPGELATLSRGGLLALAALAAGAVLTLRSTWLRVAILAGAGVAALGLTRMPFIGPRLLHALDPGTGTLDIRGDIWAATARMLRDHPVFGAGINAYQSTMVPYRAGNPRLVPEPYPHNIFLTSWTELGLLGLLAFTWIVAVLVVRPFRALRAAPSELKPLLWGTGMAFVVVLVHGLVDSPYWKNDLSLEFWILAAVQVAALRTVRAS